MRVLYVSQYFPPEMGAPAARVSELASHWARAGHEVTVLTGFPNHPTGVVPREYRPRMRRLVHREHRDGVRVVRTWLLPLPNRRSHERVLNYCSFLLSACVTGLFLSRPDVLIATTPQLLVGLAGWVLGLAKRVPFVLEVRDIWPDSITASGVGSEKSLLARTLRALARFLYARADRVVVVTPAMGQTLREAWRVPPGKISVVEHGVETDLFTPEGPHDRASTGGFVVSVIGTMGLAHGLGTVLEAAALIRDGLPEARFVFVGEGTERAVLEAEARRRGLPNVEFLPPQPRERIPALIRGSDVCLVLLKKADVFRTVIPTKMLEFMACGRPVILGVDGQARWLLEQAGAGIHVDPEDPAALAGAVVRLCRDEALRGTLGRNGRRFSVDRLSRAKTAQIYLGVLRGLAGSREPASPRA